MKNYLRHIGMWEPGWREPQRFVPKCPEGVACVDSSTPDGRIDHVREWQYANELRRIRGEAERPMRPPTDNDNEDV